jgi:hypothetical protein
MGDFIFSFVLRAEYRNKSRKRSRQPLDKIVFAFRRGISSRARSLALEGKVKKEMREELLTRFQKVKSFDLNQLNHNKQIDFYKKLFKLTSQIQKRLAKL